jgi:hypothetical protein
MHSPPPANELNFLVGLEIGQVSLDPWSLQFRFSDGGQITVEGPIEHIDPSGQSHWHQNSEDQDRGPVFFREILQRKIVQIGSEPDCLTLFLDDQAQLRIVAQTGPYESAQIYPPDGRAVPIVF